MPNNTNNPRANNPRANNPPPNNQNRHVYPPTLTPNQIKAVGQKRDENGATPINHYTRPSQW
ncbi:931_t:CDS:2 [Entrophospora sp. SA101]|nr:931_t:CDS:2 [Entrophospora sp. SA101]CAJ0926065.1 13052_t:CDS:2 [Entrophospora sp. SA101]